MKMTYEFLQDAIRNCFLKAQKINWQCDHHDARQLAKDGIVTIPGFVSSETANEYRELIHQLIGRMQGDAEGREYIDGAMCIDRGKRFKSDFNMIDIFDIEKALPELSYLKQSAHMLNVVREVSGQELKVENLNVYVNRGIKPRVLHIDSFTSTQYKAFIYLTDVDTLADGPYMYVKGSHLCSDKKILSYIENYENDNYATDMRAFSYDDATPCFGKKGTLIISDQSGVHGAHPQPESAERVLLMFNLSSSKIIPK